MELWAGQLWGCALVLLHCSWRILQALKASQSELWALLIPTLLLSQLSKAPSQTPALPGCSPVGACPSWAAAAPGSSARCDPALTQGSGFGQKSQFGSCVQQGASSSSSSLQFKIHGVRESLQNSSKQLESGSKVDFALSGWKICFPVI